MATIHVTEHIDAPLERVFDLFTDLPRAADRLSGVDRIEILTEGPVGLGTRWRETRTMWGKQATEEMEISEFVPNEHYTVIAESCGARYASTFRFSPADPGTDVTFEFAATPVSRFAKLMNVFSGMMAGAVTKVIKQDLQDLKQHAEANPVNAAHL